MKIVIDMNLPPAWVGVLQKYGWEAVHWSAIGNRNDPDDVIMAWALSNDYIVLTHDLDFSALLASTNAQGPSVVQIRARSVLPIVIEAMVVDALHHAEDSLQAGALITIDEKRARIRVLPLDR